MHLGASEGTQHGKPPNVQGLKQELQAFLMCKDLSSNCKDWAGSGECDANPKYMHFQCQKSCGICDYNSECANWASSGECDRNPEWMQSNCKKSCFSATPLACQDKKQLAWTCSNGKDQGHCFTKADFMVANCPASCRICGEGDPCRPDPSDHGVLAKSGDLSQLFNRAEHNNQDLGPKLLHKNPTVLLFENFLSSAEADAMLAAILDGKVVDGKFERSRAGGVPGADQEDPVRTSAQLWCYEACESDPRVGKVMKKIERVLGINRSRFEFLQVLRYKKGEFYKQHHDFLPHNYFTPCGPRILTLFLYLSDVKIGGETSFVELGVKVEAHKGRAVLWPNVGDSDAFKVDDLTTHESIPVSREGDVKYAVNVWVHQYDFRGEKNERWDCMNPLKPVNRLFVSGETRDEI
eukprot:gnl/MRDRNA2_/MRDRNA2_140760_c0_seq1.p1 gnl/MRDRNA2_/MRDRNA2_140760_c0~~gnl/MRDRNA2_/MRDRNA2_140760_c0_seq1.p1  ORF type:complete len:408 (+),score=72.96 gnl/MRDRNA2_/MRDRNA2_140760_c0_seq1:58-1281(+)